MTTMRMKAATTLGLAGALVGAAAVAAVGTSAASAAPSARQPLTYRITKAGAIHGPANIHPGRVIIKVAGFKGHAFQLAKRTGNQDTKAKLISDAAELNSGKTADLLTDFTVFGGVAPHNTLYVTLTKGVYYAIDTDNEKPTPAAIQRIVVSGARRDATFPSAKTLRASGEHNWSKNPKTIPAKGVLRFANRAHDAHFVELDKLKKGATLADVKKVFAGQEDQSKVFVSKGKNISYTSGVISPNHGQMFSYTLSKGTYLLACFWPDRKTGMPHALMGMIRLMKVS